MPEDRKYNILFLCTGNSARSIIAEAIMGRVGQERFNAFSAGSHPKGAVNPQALALLKKLDYGVENFRSKSWDEFAASGAPPLDFVITVCDSAAGEVCPAWPGQPMTAHWGMPDPAAVEGSDVDIALAFADAYRMLNNRIAAFANLKISGLDRLSLQKRMTDIKGLSMAEASLEPPLQRFDLSRRLAGEGLGTLLLLAAVVGSGIMSQSLAGGNVALALLGNTIATGAMLVVLITIFGPLSGAHFNPAVSVMFALRRELAWAEAALYVLAQLVGAVLGVWLAHAMFAQPILQISTKLWPGWSQGLSEGVATFGLMLTILGSLRFRPDATPFAVGLYIVAAYWFTASTSFANPAVTLARSLSDSFAGIAPASVPAFLLGQGAGAILAAGSFGWLVRQR